MELPVLSIIVPAFNEAHNLEEFLPPLIGYSRKKKWKIILVNDGSSDSTRDVLAKFDDPEILTVLHHKVNKGYGAALKTGISACNTEYCITFDADGQHYSEDIGSLFELISSTDADMVVGSRKGLKHASLIRGIGKTVIRFIAKVLMPIPIHDINSGMKIFRTDLAKKYTYLAPDTMSFSDTFTLVFINNKHLVLEKPIRIRERINGESKVGFQTAFQTIMEIINIVVLFNPMKIFLPISVICIVLTVIWGLPIALMGRGVSTGTLLGLISGMSFFLMGLVAEQLSMIRKRQN